MITTYDHETLTELSTELSATLALDGDINHRIGATDSDIPEYAYSVSFGIGVYHMSHELVVLVCGRAPTTITVFKYKTTELLPMVERAIRIAAIDEILADLT